MILVTGGAGYIGSQSIITLLEKGYEIVAFDNFSTGHKETIAKLREIGKNNFNFIEGDLLNQSDLAKCFDTYDIDAVIHFAAYSQVEESTQDPAKYYRNNVVGTLNLLDTMIKFNVKKIIYSSSAAIYGEPVKIPIDETHQQMPINTYGKTKLFIENIMDDYDSAYGLKSIKLRYFNVAGADNQARVGELHIPETHLIQKVLKSICNQSKEFEIYGNDYDTKDGTCIRDYLNIEDLAEAHVLALEYLLKNNKTDCFNLGTNQGETVKEVFDLCRKVTGKEIPVKNKPRRYCDPTILVADNKKAKEILKWEPKRDLQYSIQTAYAWETKISKNN